MGNLTFLTGGFWVIYKIDGKIPEDYNERNSGKDVGP